MTTIVSAKPKPHAADAVRRSNLRLALTLGSIAIVFFAGIIAAQFMGGYETGMTVLGAAVLLFLVVAIGRSLRGGGR